MATLSNAPEGTEVHYVNIDEFGPFLAYVDPHMTWNGWACPKFPVASVNRMIDAQNALIREGWEVDLLTWDGDNPSVLRKVSATYGADGGDLADGAEPMVDLIAPDANGNYAIGSHEWCWSVMIP